MKIQDFIADLNKRHFSLHVENGKLNVTGDKTRLTKEEILAIKKDNEVIDFIKKNKNELIEYILSNSTPVDLKRPKDISSIYRLSGLQEGLLFHGLYNDQGAYASQFICDISNVDLDAFKESWNYVLKQHTVLRSAFYYEAFSIPVQAVHKQVTMPIEVMDFTSMNDLEKTKAIKDYEESDRVLGFDFKVPPLMRIGFIRTNKSGYRMFWTFHHLLFDGWSLPVILEEFLSTYELLIAKKPIRQKEEDVYEEYIRYLQRIDRQRSEEYWRTYLNGVDQSTLLPFINSTSELTKGIGSYKSASLEFDLVVTEQIQNFAKKNLITVNTLVQGVWSYLLHSYTNSSNVLFGIIVSGRPDDLPAIEQRVGMYINSIPLHSSITDNENITGWLQRLQADQVRSREHQYTPLHEIQKWAGIQGDLFDSLLVFENYPVNKLIGEKKWSLHVENVDIKERTNYPLTITVNSAEQIYINFVYNQSLLKEEYVNNIREHFEHVLYQLIENASAKLSDIKLLSPRTQQHLLKSSSNNAGFPKEKTIIDLFEEQVKATPNAIAVIFEDEHLTYIQLNEKANQLAHFLRAEGVKNETLIPICIERGLAMIIGLLGILKAGAAYVPIDPEYPAERIAYMIEDAEASIILTSYASRLKLPATDKLNAIELDGDTSLTTYPRHNPVVDLNPNSLAYIIYTSGSTGKPKGVMIEHLNVVRLFKTETPLFDFGSADIWTMFHSFCFDFSVWEMYGALLFGGKLIIVPADATKDISLFARLLVKEKVTILNQTPSAFYNLQDYLVEQSTPLQLRYVIFGGEALNMLKVLPSTQYYPNCRFINMYGITETTVHVTYLEIQPHQIQAGRSVIGKPIPTLSTYLLSPSLQLVPLGVTGELYIGGAGLARGYLNRPELTADRFINNPFGGEAARLYKTGDLARWLPDGNLEYLGRIDEQVKIRGYRVELGEIESILQQSGVITQAVVMAREDQNGNKQLVGYVVAKEIVDKQAVIDYLKSKLPTYMVPSIWIQLEQLPLSPNGKVDKKALPKIDAGEQSNNDYVAPQNETQQSLAELWQELLGVQLAGIHDNFFELGGHSILAMQAISAIRRKMKVEVNIKDLFKYPTIHDFSKIILAHQQDASPQLAIPNIRPRPQHIPLSFSQERLWFIDQLEGTIPYHMPVVLRLKGRLNVDALNYALQSVVDRHEVLRTVIKEDDGTASQVIIAKEGWRLNVIESSYDVGNGLQYQIQQLVNQPFDLSKDYLLRADIISVESDDHILVVTMHHIASDGWSLSLIVKEVVELYGSYIEHRPVNLPVLPIQYADYAIWQRDHLRDELLEAKLAYWKKKLQNVPSLELPTDYPRSAIQTSNGDTEAFKIDRDQVQKLQSLGQQYGATLFMTLLAAFKILLYRYTGQNDICVGTPTANRSHKEVEELIGFFLNTLALRTSVEGRSSFVKLLEKVKATTTDAYAHQDVPFEKVVEAVIKERDISRNALFQVMFTLQNTPDVPALQLGEVALSSEAFENKTSKFDLSFSIVQNPSGLRGSVIYNTALFKKDTIQKMLSHFTELLFSVVTNPEKEIDKLTMLTQHQQQQLLQEFNTPLQLNAGDKTIVELFERQAYATPENIALVFADEHLTYKQLNEKSNQLAHYLIGEGVKHETLVPICVDRSFEMMVGMLGILKAGGAYVPIDPAYPPDRISYMLEDIDAKIILTSQKHAEKLEGISQKQTILAIDNEWDNISNLSTKDPKIGVVGKQLAYVLYTSGSVGKPKGVEVEHNAIAHHLLWFTYNYNINDLDSSLLISSYSFDGAMTAIWPVLIKGGSLHLFVDEVPDPSLILKYISKTSITYIKTLPGIFKEIINTEDFKIHRHCQSLRLIILGGERINSSDLKTYISYYPDVKFSNHYGPTECTVSSTFCLIDKHNIDDYSRQPVVGKPIDRTSIYILNEGGSLNPVGVPGEICIGGFYVARGYLNNKELTAEKFVEDPFRKIEGARMYKTGDVGRWIGDGNIEFLNRRDDQVKIRGYRVELGEVQNILQQKAGVRDVVVVAREDNNGDNRLIGYVVAEHEFKQEEIFSYLKKKLPAFMVPALLVEMQGLPLTPNGKIDKNALPDPSISEELRNDYTLPRNNIERSITLIWQEMLKLDKVGIHNNFFQIGGHSLLAMRVVSAIRKQLKAELSIKSLFVHPTIAELAEHIQTSENGLLPPFIEAGQRPEKIPLSFSQERLWFIDNLEGSTQYHISPVLRLKGRLNIDALKYALQGIVNRHEVLRTVILEDEGYAYQQTLAENSQQLNIIDGRHYENDRQALAAYVQQRISKPFDLSSDHMLRSELIALSADEHVLVTTMHHIASDGWSTSILVKEVVELYASFVENRTPRLEHLPIQFADYAIWQRDYLQGEILDNKLAYWRVKLHDVVPMELPTDYTRPAVRRNKGAVMEYRIGKALLQQIQLLSLQQGSTVFMTLLAAFKVLLYRYSGQQDICIGTSVSGRDQQEVESLIGFFVNLLPLRTRVNPDASFAELLKDVIDATFEAYEHQQVPFEKIVDATVKERDLSRNPLFQVVFVLQNTPEIPDLHFGDVEFSPETYEHVTAQFDLTVRIKEVADGLIIKAEYNTDLYRPQTLDRLFDHFTSLLTSIVADPKESVGRIRMLSLSEEHQLVVEYNDTSTDYPKDKTIIDLFNEQVDANPQSPALLFNRRQISYKELDEQSARLAHYLKESGVIKETLVPICMDRSAEMIIAILAILRAGGAYVPIDPNYPAERIKYIVADTKAQLLITTQKNAHVFDLIVGVNVIEMDRQWKSIANKPASDINITHPNQLAYIIYTSGSTGAPKGVMATHDNVVSLVKETNYITFGHEDVLLVTGSPSFDATTFEYWGMLLNGGQLVLCEENSLLDHEILKEEIEEGKVNIMWFTSSWFNQLVNIDITVFAKLAVVLVGGEKLSEKHVQMVRDAYPSLRIINGYGPTENTTFSLSYEIPGTNINTPIPIGRPISNRAVYILSEEKQLVPVGVTGEIYLGGSGLTRGYLNSEELTTEKFIYHSFSQGVETKLYRTGDLGRWSQDANVEYLGRKDFQVKIRGFRIELGEIENTLVGSGLVKQAVVLAPEDDNGIKRLIAYVVAENEFNNEDVTAYLVSRLPEYMVPSIIMTLDSFPLTLNGKVDKGALASHGSPGLSGNVHVAPITDLQQKLVIVWQELLEIEQVGITDNFFEIGGHSLLAIRLISAIRKQLSVEIKINQVFDYPTIEELADLLQGQLSEKPRPGISPVVRPAYIPLSFSQERLWFIDQLEGSVEYHIPAIMQLNGVLNVEALNYAIKTVVHRHEVLRTVFKEYKGTGYQYILPETAFHLEVLEKSTSFSNPQDLHQKVRELIKKPFDLSYDYMIRGSLLNLAENKHLLVVTMHHIASDGWSMSILVKEVIELYQAFTESRLPNLKPLTLQYADYAIWQRDYLQGSVLNDKLGYWKNKLAGTPSLQLPTDYLRPEFLSTKGETIKFFIDNDTLNKLRTLSREQGSTLFMTLLAAYKVLLHRYSGQHDICVGTAVAGREQHEVENLIGFFVNTLALRSEINVELTFIEFLQQVKATILEAYANQEVPFEKVVDAVVKERSSSRTPIFQTIFVLQNTPLVPELNFSGINFSPYNFETETSKVELAFHVTETEKGLQCSAQYFTELYSNNTVLLMVERFKELLNAIIAAQGKKIGALSMSKISEEKISVDALNQKADYLWDKTVVDLFEDNVLKTPDSIALVLNNESFTYKQLNESSNRLAHYLVDKGVEEEDFVPICIDRSFDMIIGIIAILKAGAAYVPVDPAYPEDRIHFMLEDIGASIVLSSAKYKSKLKSLDVFTVICLDDDAEAINKMPAANPGLEIEPNSLAYVIYTSGSTGTPKGVTIMHRGFINMAVDQVRLFNVVSTDRILQFASVSFDASVYEIFIALFAGATLVLMDKEMIQDTENFPANLRKFGITIVTLPPVYLKALHSDDLTSLRVIITAGEAADVKQATYLSNFVDYYNAYGPTECSVCVSIYKVKPEDATKGRIPIGKPIANTNVYILDDNKEVVPTGIQGEIYVSGIGLAKGYHKRRDLTAEKFIANPFGTGKKLYRTGDLGRWLEDGNIEFLGRRDDQIKIRGFRVELGEIENTLLEHNDIQNCVVVANGDEGEDRQIIAYYQLRGALINDDFPGSSGVAEATIEKDDLRGFVSKKLPDYMVPSLLIELQNFPTTVSGKIDRKALPKPNKDLLGEQYVAPRNQTETDLAEIWQEVLEVAQVGIHDNFFELGGHSLLAIRLISEIRVVFRIELGISLVFDYPTIEKLAEHIVNQSVTNLLPAIGVQVKPEFIPLSFSQEGLWFIDRMEGSLPYNVPVVLRLKGALNKQALYHALQTIVDRHQVLRTVIKEQDGQPYQHIIPYDGFVVNEADGSMYAESPEELKQHIDQVIKKPFDLSKDYMLRADLISLSEQENLLVVTMHHIASDGWSLSIIVKEVVALYEAFTRGSSANLPSLPIQYADYALWQRNYFTPEVYAKKLDYWRQKLQGVAPLQFPTDYPRHAHWSSNGAIRSFSINKELSDKLDNFSKQQGSTMFMTLLAALKVLLYRYTGQQDICVGTSVAGRQQKELESLVGFFINLIAFRSNVNGDDSFIKFLGDIKATTLEAFDHQEVPFERVIDAVTKERGASRHPICQVMLVLQNTPEVVPLTFGEVQLSREVYEQTTSQYDLIFRIAETNNGLRGTLEFATDLYSEATMMRMISHYRHLLNAIVSQPGQRIDDLSLLLPEEEKLLLSTFNNTVVKHPAHKTIVDLFEEQANKIPNGVAIEFGEKQLTYKEVNERANKLAHLLHNTYNVTTDVLVPICIERSFEMIVSILGVLKAGGAYIPIDPEYPTERIGYMMEDSGATISLCSQNTAAALEAQHSLAVIEVDSEFHQISQSAENLHKAIQPNHLAYVIYTSGSTGKPKGVMVEHGGVVNLALNQASALRLQPGMKTLQFASFGFDASCYEIFNTLLSGGCLVLSAKKDILSAEVFKELIHKHKVELAVLPPSYLDILKDSLDHLHTIVSAGEPLSESLATYIQAKNIRLINAYGPTENTVCVTLTDEPVKDNHTVVIGKPISNVAVYIVDKGNKLLPLGSIGEICVAGAQVARGYLNRPALTAEKFIENPFNKDNGWSKLYKTGDLGRWLINGDIEFAGRIDDQVKIRGYRIEPGEIESVILQSKLVSQAVVLAKEDNQGDKRLVGYVVVDAGFVKQELTTYIESKLPEYMVPAMIIEMEKFPLTANGKIDRKALPDPDATNLINSEFVSPRNNAELKLAGIWQDLLELEKVGIHNNFFELGGHSLLAIRLISAIRKELDVEVEIGKIFEFSTIAQLAEHIKDQYHTAAIPPLTKMERPSNIPLSFSQERLWFLDKLEGSQHYYIPAVLQLDGALNEEALNSAFRSIINRHEVLRTVIVSEDGGSYQRILDENKWKLNIVDGSIYNNNRNQLQQYVEQLIATPFDLSNDYMLKGYLINLSKVEHILVVTMHHISSDGWSMSILVKELVELYQSHLDNREAQLPSLPIQYADYSLWQRKHLQGDVFNKKLIYWKSKLEGIAALQLPTDFVRPVFQSLKGAVVKFNVDQALSSKLYELSKTQGATIFMTLLSALKVLLYRYSGQEDICVGTPIANRTQHELEGLIGFFVNTLALRSKINDDASFVNLLQEVKATTLEAFKHQDVPFEKVVDAVVNERDLSRSILFQVMLVLHNNPEVPNLALGDVVVSPLESTHNTSKFDLTFFITEGPNGLNGTVEYATDLYRSETILRMVGHFKELLSAVVQTPNQSIGLLPMLDKAEHKQLLYEYNDTAVDIPIDTSVIELFEQQVKQTPEAIAVVFGKEQLSYAELNVKANQLAYYLRRKGVKGEALVPVCIERSIEMIVGVLAILKAGGVYVPIDPEYPADRIKYMLNDIGSSLVISSRNSRSNLHALEAIDIIEIDGDWSAIACEQKDNLGLISTPDQLVYVLYTSGSTGRPKGVMMPGSALVNLLHWQDKQFVNKRRHVLQFASLNFDVSFQEIFSTLCFGSSLYLIEEDRRKDMSEMVKEINLHKITHLFVPYIVFKSLAEFTDQLAYDSLSIEEIIVAGEQLKLTEDIQRLISKCNIRLVNQYGPTEAHVVSSFSVTENYIDCPLPPIGKPIDNVQLYILDSNGQLSPKGVPGELCIGGVQVSNGYLNRPELTSEKFVTNPLAKGRMYRTGDLARWLPDGNLEYLGRIDEQVKIRGYRVELGEIESVMLQSGLVDQAVVLSKDDSQNNKRLVAYVVSQQKFEQENLVSYLKAKLPEYMVPSLFVKLESLPLSPNGKIDKKALPDPNVNELLSHQYVPPRNDFEQQIADIWQSLLNVEKVGIHDNFFALGGHSILAMRTISLMRQKLKVEVSIRDLFLHSTIADLSQHVRKDGASILLKPIVKRSGSNNIPLSFSQERLWFIDQLEGSRHYHISNILRLKGTLNIEALSAALKTIVNRHEVLRSVIIEKEGQGYQHVLGQDEWNLEIVQDHNIENDPSALSNYLGTLLYEPFNLSTDHMLRAHLIVLKDQEFLLAVTMHHIASDGWSMSVLVRELVELYSAFADSRPAKLVPIELQYADYAVWQRGYLEGEILEAKLAYWKQKLEGITPLQLPVDYARPVIQSNKGAATSFKIDKDLSHNLKTLNQTHGATMFMTLLSAFKVVLYKYSGQSDICVGTPIANRSQQELEALIGFFINTLALRTNVNDDVIFTDLLQQVKLTTLEAYDHQDVPFEKVVDAVVSDRSHSRNQIFQVMFVLQNTPDIPKLQLGDVTLSPEGTTHTTSMFDMTLYVKETPEGLIGTVEYSTDLYSKETIEQFTNHYKNLLASVVKTPGATVGELQILSKAEEHKLLYDFNDTYVEFPTGKTVVDLFKEQVLKTPSDTALVFGQRTFTYKELDERSNRLAHYLISRGVIENTLVPICIDRGIDMVIGILSILKAGGTYIPIDADYPLERIKYVITDTAATIVLTNKKSSSKIHEVPGVDLVVVDDVNIVELGTSNSTANVSPASTICVTYTSGSTGQPKGVRLTHQGVVNRIFWMWKKYPFVQNERCAVKTSIGFVDHIWELFGPLTKGVTCVLFTKEDIINLDVLTAKLIDEKITRWVIVPSLLRALLDKLKADNLALPHLKYWTSSGETLNLDLVDDFYKLFPASSHKLLNIYGSSEVTADVTCYDTSEVLNAGTVNEINRPKKGAGSVSIGKPIANSQVYIVDKNGRLLPQGAWGEIYVGGVQVANGYLNAAELTATRFIADFITNKPGAVLFKTGDAARWLPNGNIEYQGRIDGQVKIRGHRIEPGEIESILKQSSLISEAVVIAKEDVTGPSHLVGYVVPSGAFDKQVIVKYLKTHLPEYMVPAIWVTLNELPLLPNGKLNKYALPDPDVNSLLRHQYVAPETETAIKMAAIWQELLVINQVGLNDDFFELGGHSILIMKLVSAIKKTFGISVPIHVVFQFSTVDSLSNYLDWERNAVEDENSAEVETINI